MVYRMQPTSLDNSGLLALLRDYGTACSCYGEPCTRGSWPPQCDEQISADQAIKVVINRRLFNKRRLDTLKKNFAARWNDEKSKRRWESIIRRAIKAHAEGKR